MKEVIENNLERLDDGFFDVESNNSILIKENILRKENIERKEEILDEITQKGKNIEYKDEYDIKFTIGSKIFENIINFMNEISLDIVFEFGKTDIKMYVMSASGTDRCNMSIGKNELAEYYIDDENEDSEKKVVYVDVSILKDLMIDTRYAMDVYIDTLSERKITFICGNESVWSRLKSMSNEGNNVDATVNFSKGGFDKTIELIKNEKYQKVVILGNVMKKTTTSIGSKGIKGKSANPMTIYLLPNKINFSFENESKGSSIELKGEDILVYPTKDDKVGIDANYIKKLSGLEMGFQCNVYMNREMPFICEVKMGSGEIKLYYTLAHYVIPD